MKRHTITLLDGPGDGLRVPAELLIELVSVLQEGAQRAARLFIDGESVRKGPKPAWLEAVAQLEVTGLTAGSAVLSVEAPRLAEAAPERFAELAQIPLFGEPAHTLDAQQTAIDLFASVLLAAVNGDVEGVPTDRPMLETCARFARIPRGAFRAVSLESADGGTVLVLGVEDAPRIERLRDATPQPQAVRIVGMLDTISATRDEVVLKLADGTAVPARLGEHDTEALRELFNCRVAISGLAFYRSSGRLHFIDVEDLSPARAEGEALFERIPLPWASRPVARPSPQDDSTGVNAIFGIWPGEESDDELLAALSEIE